MTRFSLTPRSRATRDVRARCNRDDQHGRRNACSCRNSRAAHRMRDRRGRDACRGEPRRRIRIDVDARGRTNVVVHVGERANEHMHMHRGHKRAITATHARADMSLIAGKPCSAATENRARSRLKRGGFATIEGLFYGNPGANFAAASILRDQLQLAFYTDRPSWNAAIAYRRVRLALIVMPFSFTSRSDHHVSTASIARRGADRRVVRDETGRSLPTARVRHAVGDMPDEERAQDRRGPTEAF